MNRDRKQLVLKIEQSGKVSYHRLDRKAKITIGRSPENDITLYGEDYPKKHVLFANKNGHVELHIQKYMKGEVRSGESRLTFKDLILHNLLPVKGDSFFYPLTKDKEGYLQAGDAKISFRFDGIRNRIAQDENILGFKGFSWLRATVKDAGKDLPFKAIVLFFIVFHVLALRYLSEHAKGFSPHARGTSSIPERLTRFVIKKQPIANIENKTEATTASDTEAAKKKEEARAKASKSKKTSDEKVAVESQGVLGLLSGTGSSNQTNALADVLMDKGLASSLDEVMSNSKLKIGKGKGNSDDLDDLIALSEVDGGIDDILGDVGDQVESVSLSRKADVQVERVGEMTGSPRALGQRSEESVRAVLASYMGRLKYIYEKHLKRTPSLAGKMVVEVAIAANGRVENVKLLSSTMNNSEFEREIMNVIRRWKYDAIDEGTITVTYPLVFNRIE